MAGQAARPSRRLLALHGLFLLSGALGLAYEVLWMRRLSTLFGSTTLASAAALSAFFLGTTLGSVALGTRSTRWARPLRAFGLLEIGVGLGALAVGPILRLYSWAYPRLHAHLSSSPDTFALAKLGLAFLAVAAPAFFMGGTLPALGEGVAPRGGRLGVSVGSLYAVNVLGASLGALAVPFLLLPALGVHRAELGLVAGSLLVGLMAVAVGTGMDRAADDSRPRDVGHSTRPLSTTVLLLAAWSGLATLGLEALWTRMLSLVHESSVRSFAVVLVVFLLGLAAGAALARILLGAGQPPRRALGWGWTAAGALVVASPRVFDGLTGGLQFLPASEGVVSAAQLAAVAGVTLLPACIALGLALPLLMEMSGQGGGSAGPLLGRLLAANTGGAIAGPLVVTFLVAPALGLWKAVVAIGLATAAVGAMAGLRRGQAAASLAGVALLVAWLRPDAVPPARIRLDRGERLVSLREGTYGTVAVLADSRDRWITVNNAYVLGGAAAAAEERWQGHLPLLLHPHPRRVAFVGMGTGIAAGAALAHPVTRLVALEIVPEVAEAARADFSDVNAGVVADPRTDVVVDDGRNYLASAPAGSFDVVVGDLLVPWRPGESELYTREHLASVRRALAPDGLFCQWLPLYQLSDRQLAILVGTFLDVFPATTVWRGNFLPDAPTLALVGRRDPAPLDAGAIDGRVRALTPSGEDSPMLADPAGLWLHLVGSPRRGAAWLTGDPANTDDVPRLEMLSTTRRRPLTDAAMESALERIASSSQAPSLSRLDDAHRAWWRTGMALGRSTLDRGAEGEARTLSLLRTLPEPLRLALGVPAP